jgi:hypothetical protein
MYGCVRVGPVQRSHPTAVIGMCLRQRAGFPTLAGLTDLLL